MDSGNHNAVVPINAKVDSPDDLIFWREIRAAYDQVATHAHRQILVERGSKQAKIYHNPKTDHIMVALSEIVPEQPTLIKP